MHSLCNQVQGEKKPKEYREWWQTKKEESSLGLWNAWKEEKKKRRCSGLVPGEEP